MMSSNSKIKVNDLTLGHIGRVRVRLDTDIQGEHIAASGMLKMVSADDFNWDTDIVTAAELRIGRVEVDEVPVDTELEILN